MQEAELRLLFSAGELKKATITTVPLSEGWCLQFLRRSGRMEVLDSQRASLRQFKTFGSAFQAARKIGFREVLVVTPCT